MFSLFCRWGVSLFPVPVMSQGLQQVMGSIALCSFDEEGIHKSAQTTIVTFVGVTQCCCSGPFADMILVD